VPEASLMLAFIRDHNTAKSVTDLFNDLYGKLGHDIFVSLFPVILGDYAEEKTMPKFLSFA